MLTIPDPKIIKLPNGTICLVTPQVLTARQIEWAYRKWCEGHPLSQIAAALDITIPALKRELRGRPRVLAPLVYEETKDND